MLQLRAVTLEGAQAIDVVVLLMCQDAQQLVAGALTAMNGWVNNDVLRRAPLKHNILLQVWQHCCIPLAILSIYQGLNLKQRAMPMTRKSLPRQGSPLFLLCAAVTGGKGSSSRGIDRCPHRLQ